VYLVGDLGANRIKVRTQPFTQLASAFVTIYHCDGNSPRLCTSTKYVYPIIVFASLPYSSKVDAIPYLALGLQVFGAISLASAISGTFSFVFSNFVRPGVSVRSEVLLIRAHSHAEQNIQPQLKKFGANKGAWAGERLDHSQAATCH
jgi:hypothetical protein